MNELKITEGVCMKCGSKVFAHDADDQVGYGMWFTMIEEEGLVKTTCFHKEKHIVRDIKKYDSVDFNFMEELKGL